MNCMNDEQTFIGSYENTIFSVLGQFVPLYFRHPWLNLWHFLLGLDTQYFLGILINIDDIPLSWDWVDRIILWKLDQLSSLLSWKRSCGEFYVNFPTILRHFSNIYYWTNWVAMWQEVENVCNIMLIDCIRWWGLSMLNVNNLKYKK